MRTLAGRAAYGGGCVFERTSSEQGALKAGSYAAERAKRLFHNSKTTAQPSVE